MKVRDKNLKRDVDVSERDCPCYQCYWPRPNPGSFVQGRGYKSYGDTRDTDWLCGTRAIRGCPDFPQKKRKRVMKLDILFELDSLAEIYDNPIKCAARDAAIEIRKLRAAIADTLKENGHLADGDCCTLIKIKQVMPNANRPQDNLE